MLQFVRYFHENGNTVNQKALTDKIFAILQLILEEKGIESQDLQLDETLYEEGLGLDSLDTATLSVHLENEFGADPYSAEEFPRTVREIIAYYTSNLTDTT